MISDKTADDLKMFLNILKRHYNDDFFDRPDCVATLWLKLIDNWESILEDPITNTLEEYLIEKLRESKWEWANHKGVIVNENTIELTKAVEKFQTKNIPEFDELSIKEVAIQMNETNNEHIRYLMARVFLIDPDTYMLEAW